MGKSMNKNANPEGTSANGASVNVAAARSIPQPFSLKAALAIVLCLNALRLMSGLFFDLVPQEAYYFLYSQHPALSYFDHPPMMAWSLWLFTSVFGAHPFVLRLTAFTLTALTQFLFFVLARRFLPASKVSGAVLLFCTTAMVSVISLISLPDVPLLLFWTISLVCLERAIFQKDLKFWIFAGISMGLAFDGKYTAAMLQVGLGLFLVFSRGHRRWLKTPWPYLSILLAHVTMLPVYVWNAQNGFASFLFQSANRAQGWSGLHPINFLKLLGTQTALLLPALLVAVCYAFKKACVSIWKRRRLPAAKPLFLLCFFAPLFIGFTGLSFITLVKPNWMMPAWVTGILLAAMLVDARVVRINLILVAVLHLATAVELVAYPVPVTSDDTWYGWSELARQAQELADQRPDHIILADDSYKTSAELGFYMNRKTYSGNLLGKKGLQYDYLGDDLSALKGRDALFFDSTPRELSDRRDIALGAPPRKIGRHFEAVQELPPVLIRNPFGKVVRKFRVFDCKGYKGPQPPPEEVPMDAPGALPVDQVKLPDGTVLDIVVQGQGEDPSKASAEAPSGAATPVGEPAPTR